MGGRGIRVLYGVPLLKGDELIGVAQMGSFTAANFSEEDKLVFRMMVSRVTALLVQAEVQLLLDTLVAASPVGVAFVDRDMRYVRINEALASVNGRPAREHIGKTIREVLPDAAEALESIVQRILATGEALVDVEVTAPPATAGGSPRHLLCNYYPVRDATGEVAGVGVMTLDVTRQKEASERRRAAEERLEQAARFREEFIGILGHDLRTPLGAILGSAHLLLRQGNLNEPQAKAVARIARSADRMSRMISDVLDFTQARLGGGFSLARRDTDLSEVCRQAVDELLVAHPERRIDVAESGACHGVWDPDRLAQVVSNLVANAIKYGDAETPVRVTIDGSGDDVVTLRVANEGKTIPPEMIPVLFRPFTRAGTADGETKSLGLGLYIVKQIVDAHGGAIEVTSLDRVTTATVRLPRRA